MERKTIEQQIFTWEQWDELDGADMQFYDVELIVPVGQFPVGTKFPLAMMLTSESLLALVDQDQNQYTFSLLVSVGEQVEQIVHKDACGCGHSHDHD